MTPRDQVMAAVNATPWLRCALEAVRDVGPPRAWVGAGAVRDAVWDVIAGASSRDPAGDIDVVHFDAHSPAEVDADHRARLATRLGSHCWEVTNQAVVHSWHSRRLGRPIAPYPSLEAAIAEWPETATALGASIDAQGRVSLLAPLGLDDLVLGIVRPNRRCPDRNAFRTRLATKRWRERWPHLTVMTDDG